MKDAGKIDDENLNEQLRAFFLEKNSREADEQHARFILEQEYNVKIDAQKEHQLLKKLSKNSKGFGNYSSYLALPVVLLGLFAGLLYFTHHSDTDLKNTVGLESANTDNDKSLVNNTTPERPDSSFNHPARKRYSSKPEIFKEPPYSFDHRTSNSDSTKTGNDIIELPAVTKRDTVLEKEEPLKPIEALANLAIGESIVFPNLHFQPGSSFLTFESGKKEFPKLLKVMKENPKLKIEIQGHITAVCKNCRFATDDKDTRYLRPRPLSVTRAKYIYDDLVRKGIDPERMTYKGYGNTKPLVMPEITEADRDKNRRVEIKVLDR